MKTLLALGIPLIVWNLAVADAAGLDAWVEIAKQVPALLVLVWMVNKFLAFLRSRDETFTGEIRSIASGFRESHDRSTEAIRENTKATTRLYQKIADSGENLPVIRLTPAEYRRLGMEPPESV